MIPGIARCVLYNALLIRSVYPFSPAILCSELLYPASMRSHLITFLYPYCNCPGDDIRYSGKICRFLLILFVRNYWTLACSFCEAFVQMRRWEVGE